MTRNQEEQFTQDRLGNVNRNLDPIRAIDGMEEGRGLTEVLVGEEDTPLVLLEIPSGASGFHIEEVHGHNSSDGDGTFTLWSATLDDAGEIDQLTKRSVPFNVGGGVTRTIPYSGKEFGEDAVVIQSGFEGEIAVGGYMDHREEHEPSTEQRQAPGE